jgi:Mg2+ and Co2+ transporter CorA
VWLDLQNPGADQLRAFCQSLRLDEQTLRALTTARQRPSFTSAADSVHAVVPSVNPGRPAGDLLGIRVLFTGRFLLTVHPEPCPALEEARRLYHGLPGDKKADGPFVLFFVLDQLVDTFEPGLVQLDAKLDAIQVALLDRPPRGVQQELIKGRHVLSEAVQALGWYAGDLGHFLGAGQLPGINASAEPLFSHHRTPLAQLREAAKDYRDEAQDALGQLASNVSARQGQVINLLTVVAAVQTYPAPQGPRSESAQAAQ